MGFGEGDPVVNLATTDGPAMWPLAHGKDRSARRTPQFCGVGGNSSLVPSSSEPDLCHVAGLSAAVPAPKQLVADFDNDAMPL